MIKTLKTITDIQNFHQQYKGEKLGFVPTMGNLHEGHLSLISLAQKHSNRTIVSIFVNPTQFAPDEDLNTYPRTFQNDLEKLNQAGVDAVFFPDEKTIYPYGSNQTLSIRLPESITGILCGLGRPTHFQGVATVVAKLLQIVKPQIAVFGEKDFQQLAIIRRLNEELFFDVAILAGNIKRETNGIALSSRNQYLSIKEKQQAIWLSKTLKYCKTQLINGKPVKETLQEGKQILQNQYIDVDYLDFRDIDTLSENPVTSRGILLVAGHIGRTRLIDNLRIIDIQ